MNTRIYRVLSREYEKKRDRALLEAERRKREFLERYPELQEIEDQLNQLGINLTKAILHAGKSFDEVAKDLSIRMSQLKERKQKLLQSLGISQDVFKPQYECSLCKDTGFIEEENWRMCSCYKQQIINMVYKQVNLELLEKENFQTFNPELYSNERNVDKYGSYISPRENILKIKKKAWEFIEKFDDPNEKNLLFVGETGVGKTFMANCIAKEILERGKTVIYQTAPRLLDLIMAYKMRRDIENDFDDEEYNSLFEVDLLIIDDLGTEMHTEARFSEIFTIINTRLLTHQSKCTKTIISTNFSLEKMSEYYDDRIMSRILGEFYVCKFFGEDLRLTKKGRMS